MSDAAETKTFDAEAFADQVDAEARAWILSRYGSAAVAFAERNMVTAYRSGYAAGLAHARKTIMDEATP